MNTNKYFEKVNTNEQIENVNPQTTIVLQNSYDKYCSIFCNIICICLTILVLSIMALYCIISIIEISSHF